MIATSKVMKTNNEKQHNNVKYILGSRIDRTQCWIRFGGIHTEVPKTISCWEFTRMTHRIHYIVLLMIIL